METPTIFNEIASRLSLGNIISPAKKLTGGFAHEVFSLETDSGKYAIKLLNPEIMQYALDMLTASAQLEDKLQAHNIPIVPALEFNGTKMQAIDNQHFYIFDFIEGQTLATQDIKKAHCEIIGAVLAQIHNIPHDAEGFERYETNIDWDDYIQIATEKDPAIASLLIENRGLLYKAQTDMTGAYQGISNCTVISNGDMDSKNVLWVDGKPHIIDLEYLTYTNPYAEVFQLALCWSGCEHYAIDYELLKAFMTAYTQGYGAIAEDWEVLYKSNAGSRLEWLELNVRKALMLDGDSDADKKIGKKYAEEAMKYTVYYAHIKDELLRQLKSFNLADNDSATQLP